MIKDRFSAVYIDRKYGDGQRWATQHAKDLTAQTGVRWVWYTASGKYTFIPNWHAVPDVNDPHLEQRLLDLGRGEISTNRAWASSGASLRQVLGVLKKLAREGRITIYTGRVDGISGYKSNRNKK